MSTFKTNAAVGLREDLTDMIYDISPTETPFMSSVGKTKATATFHEWQTDSLAAVNTGNAAVEGDDASSATLAPTTRLGNYTQIVQKTISVSGTLDVVNKAGRKSEKAYQLAKASAELKRDMEAICLSNQARAAGSSSVARKLGSVLSWIKTNTSKGTGGADPTTIGASARTDGTVRAFTEAQLKDVIAKVFDQGGSPKILMVGSGLKQKASTFAGIAGQRFNVTGMKPSTIIGAADIYVSDFGNVSIVPNRFMRARDALVLDPEYAALAYLRPFVTNELAKTGDSEKTQLLAEFTLEMRNEAAHGGVFDLDAAL
ncbi:MAG: DUF5309 domain-containing protein [Burkholderiaceae bacterium]|nr:DUF5309 domain-containing protein [Burkholderiaceae bacterium]